MISPKRECEVRANLWMESGRAEGEGNLVILNLKANSCYYWPVLFFCVLRGGSCPFEPFRICDNGWMLRTYVGRPLWLMEEELHAGPLSLRKFKAAPFTPYPSVNECVSDRMPL